MAEQGNIIHCTCGRQWRFRWSQRGHMVYCKPRPFLGIVFGWKLWKGGFWHDPIPKFRCFCGRNLRNVR
ncbi:hypothetical protein [Deinococcus cellulosilyticus]|uniref:Uncharacterized protein n=1 Tax=Deinococcus cellulosilyticus (strain DSM 18568 / NBRC 106333 / KACC 11606 / 5516J-15) TaxID=1223518 RepID=A0A511N127_DEIC1|nr:hypothetical protein [Deinococcus cellulosilyticus]GEM46583.1 hypothetical protein DC3_22180 [Deinococcus cellulosilyticus NBRC 106333 = KACC 11606]